MQFPVPKQALPLAVHFHLQAALCPAQLGMKPQAESDKGIDPAEKNLFLQADILLHRSVPHLLRHGPTPTVLKQQGTHLGAGLVPVGEEGMLWFRLASAIPASTCESTANMEKKTAVIAYFVPYIPQLIVFDLPRSLFDFAR